MASSASLLISLFLIFILNTIISDIPLPAQAISSCNGPCQTSGDCDGQLICIKGQCNDDPDVGTAGNSDGSSSDGCQPSGTYNCNGYSGNTYSCSPPVTSSTQAQLTNNDFSKGGDGGGASSCDGAYHNNSELIVALSTGWYHGGSRCENMIWITASDGTRTKAKVVDECDSMHGCDAEHAGLPPCKNNIVDGYDAVWSALRLNKTLGVVHVTWSMA